VDVFDAKADALAVLALAGAPTERLQQASNGPSWYHPGRVGSLTLGPKNRLAIFGEIHPKILAALDVAGPLVAFEVELDAIPLAKASRTARPAMDVSDLQAVTRDYAFVVRRDIAADRIVRGRKRRRQAPHRRGGGFRRVFTGEAIGRT
jgi:phenylalanyl-tRNA synthetase beta chain